MKDDEAAVYDFCIELHRTRNVDDAAFNRALALFGEQGVVDLIGVSGYYTAVSMTLNVAHVMPPDGVPLPLKPLNGAPASERAYPGRRTAKTGTILVAPLPHCASLHAGYFPSAMTNAPPSPRVRGEGRDEGAFQLGSELRQRPLTRIASQSDLARTRER